MGFHATKTPKNSTEINKIYIDASIRSSGLTDVYQTIYNDLNIHTDALCELIKNKNYKTILSLISKVSKKYMIQKKDYDIFKLCPFSEEVSQQLEIEYVNASYVDFKDEYIAEKVQSIYDCKDSNIGVYDKIVNNNQSEDLVGNSSNACILTNDESDKIKINNCEIHENYLSYIACQYPKEKYIERFVEFIQKSGANLIISLVENGNYLSDEYLIRRKSVYMENKLVNNMIDNDISSEYAQLTIQKSAGDVFLYDESYMINNKEIRRIRCVKWNDHGIITIEQMEFLHNYILNMASTNRMIIHCRAGVGRTGTFIMYEILKKRGKVSAHEFIKILLVLRSQRPYLVENICQLEFLANLFIKS